MKRFLAAVLLALVSLTTQAQIVGTTIDLCVTNPQSSPACPGYRTYHTFGDDTWVNVPLKFPFPFYGQVFTNSFMFSNGVVGFMSVGQQPWDSFCCSGEPINNSATRFNYTIMPLNTDLYPQPNSVFWTEGSTAYQRYVWENIGEISNGANLNTFGVEIKPSGYIGIHYDKVKVDQQTTSAVVGNAALGEYNLHFYGSGFTTASVPSLIEYTSTGNACYSNPLSSPKCPGYLDAQCSANPLYDVTCPGYQTAYFSQQCLANPLYAVTCPGYQEAYYTQQCTLNPLYANTCPGYAVAYKTQQCSLNALYANDCPGYEVAYFNDQCLKDSLYSPKCEGYKTAYAIKYLVKLDPAVTTSVNQQLTSIVEVQRADPANTVSSTGDTTVDAVIATPAATSVTSPTSTVANNAAPSTTISPVTTSAPVAPTPVAAEKQAEQKADAKKTDTAVAGVEKKAGGDPKAARAEAAAKAKEIAGNIAKATTLEQQTAQQGLVVGLIGYVPGFSAYQNSIVPDSLGATVAKQYHKPVIDNRAAQRRLSGANEYKWQQIVDSQYTPKD